MAEKKNKMLNTSTSPKSIENTQIEIIINIYIYIYFLQVTKDFIEKTKERTPGPGVYSGSLNKQKAIVHSS